MAKHRESKAMMGLRYGAKGTSALGFFIATDRLFNIEQTTYYVFYLVSTFES